MIWPTYSYIFFNFGRRSQYQRISICQTNFSSSGLYIFRNGKIVVIWYKGITFFLLFFSWSLLLDVSFIFIFFYFKIILTYFLYRSTCSIFYSRSLFCILCFKILMLISFYLHLNYFRVSVKIDENFYLKMSWINVVCCYLSTAVGNIKDSH